MSREPENFPSSASPFSAAPHLLVNCFSQRAAKASTRTATMTPRMPLAALAVAFAHVTLVGPAVYPELHVSSCTPSRDAQLVNPGPKWMRSGFESAGFPWRSAAPAPPTSIAEKVRALFTVTSRERDVVEPTALFQRARQVVHLSSLACVGLITATGASILSDKRGWQALAGAVGGGAIAAATCYGAVFHLFSIIFQTASEKDVLIFWCFVLSGSISAFGATMCVCFPFFCGLVELARALSGIAKRVLPSRNRALTTAHVAAAAAATADG